MNYKLRDVVEVIRNGLVVRQNQEAKGYPLTRIETIADGEIDPSRVGYAELDKGQVEKFRLQPGDILFSHINSVDHIGKTAIYSGHPELLIHGMNLLLLRPNKKLVDPDFLHYFLKSSPVRAIWKTQAKRAVNQASLNQKNIGELDVPIPLLQTQKQIVTILKRADDLKRNRQQANQLTNKIIQSVFLKMFGNNEPQNKVGDVATFVSSGSTPLGGEKTYLETGITFIRSQNVLMNELDLQGVAHISEETHRKMRRTCVKNGDVLLNITGASLGRVAVYRGESDKANVNQHVCIIRLNEKKALPEYISFYLSTSRAQEQIWTIQAGASRQALNFEQVKSLNLYLPDIKEQETFSSYVTKIESLQDRQKQGTQEINGLFHSLMHKAFRGELAANKSEAMGDS